MGALTDKVSARKALDDFRINGTSPFCDARSSVLENAHGLCVVLAAAFQDADDNPDGALSSMREGLKGRAIAAIGDLIALALLAQGGGE